MAKTSRAGELRLGGVSDAAVLKSTGKSWAQWLKQLDAAGAKKLTHPEIAAYLKKKCGLSGWWSQMVTVGYEQARGRREPYQRTSGYAANVSRTISAPLSALYDAWEDEKSRRAWLGKENFTIRKATPRKSLRITWSDRATNLEVNFLAKGAKKSQVAVEHSKLENLKAVEQSKSYWSQALGRLKNQLEG
jgi:uncharacterized protein YndB with AHSA1/START domain